MGNEKGKGYLVNMDTGRVEGTCTADGCWFDNEGVEIVHQGSLILSSPMSRLKRSFQSRHSSGINPNDERTAKVMDHVDHVERRLSHLINRLETRLDRILEKINE